MEIKINLDPVHNFVAKNWFKLCILAVLIVMALRSNPLKINLGGGSAPLIESSPRETITNASHEMSTEANLLSGWSIESDNRFSKLNTINEGTKKDYMKRFAKVVIQEQQKFGIPASVMLSAALLQSEAGTRSIAANSFNHFGLPCSDSWTGKRTEVDGCFRAYESAWESFRDFSKYITQTLIQANLKPADISADIWMVAMQKAKILTNSGDIKNLQSIIKKYNLEELDEMAKGK